MRYYLVLVLCVCLNISCASRSDLSDVNTPVPGVPVPEETVPKVSVPAEPVPEEPAIEEPVPEEPVPEVPVPRVDEVFLSARLQGLQLELTVECEVVTEQANAQLVLLQGEAVLQGEEQDGPGQIGRAHV